MRRPCGLLFGLMLGLTPVPGSIAAAAAGPWLLTVDAESSEIRFTLGATLHTVRGSLALAGGEVLLDAAAGRLSGEIAADVLSAETGHAGRDRKMHSRVLESDRFPRLALELERLEGEVAIPGTSRVKIHGALELHGDRHDLVVPAQVRIEDGAVEARGRFTVPYAEWGLTDPSTLFLRVAPEVEVEVILRGTLGPADP